jgi:hypothetical protein
MRALPAAALLLLPLVASGTPAPDPLAAQPMRGPFKRIRDFCKDCRSEGEHLRVKKPPAPFLDIRVVASGDPKARPTPSNQRRHYLAVRLDSGWWLHDLGFSGVICGGESQSWVSLHPLTLEARDVIPGGAPEILLTTDEGVMGDGVQIDDRRLHVCGVGVGPGSVPACATLLHYRFTGSAQGSWDLAVDFEKDGTLTLKDGSGAPPAATKRYTLTLP